MKWAVLLLALAIPETHAAARALHSRPFRIARPSERLFMIHHSRGHFAQLSRAFCSADLEQPAPSSSLVHSCPSYGGASGSLLIAETDGAIVGIHHSNVALPDRVKGKATPMTAVTNASKALPPR